MNFLIPLIFSLSAFAGPHMGAPLDGLRVGLSPERVSALFQKFYPELAPQIDFQKLQADPKAHSEWIEKPAFAKMVTELHFGPSQKPIQYRGKKTDSFKAEVLYWLREGKAPVPLAFKLNGTDGCGLDESHLTLKQIKGNPDHELVRVDEHWSTQRCPSESGVHDWTQTQVFDLTHEVKSVAKVLTFERLENFSVIPDTVDDGPDGWYPSEFSNLNVVISVQDGALEFKQTVFKGMEHPVIERKSWKVSF